MFENLFSVQGLSLDRLKSFLAFVDAKSIVRAAGGDASRQTLISRQIRELEEFFGVELVRRQGRGLALTNAGRTLAVITREQFGALDEFAREAKAQPATLSIVAPNSIATWLVMPRLAEIRRKLPHHQFVIQHEQTPAIIRGVLEGSHDIGFLRETALPRSLGRKALGGAGFALFVPKAFASRVNVKQPSSWLRLPLALPIGGTLRGAVDALAAKEGIKLSPLLGCDSYVQAAAAVIGGAVAS
ncbi:hypothetical protein AYO49_04430, partial [Verrucomicrobiaceae bacterium SCGC AG-212-N21]